MKQQIEEARQKTIRRFWDSEHQVMIVKILPGQVYVTKEEEAIATSLGSCIAVCLRDKESMIGGMNHFMLPAKGSVFQTAMVSEASRYGNWAMEFLINELLKEGAIRRNLQAKIFGGGHIMRGDSDISQQNINFVLKYIYDENIELLSKDVGENVARQVLYFPKTGKVKVKRLTGQHQLEIEEEEQAYEKSFQSTPIQNDIELF